MVKFRISAAGVALACGLLALAPAQAQMMAAGGGGGARGGGGGGGGVAGAGRVVIDTAGPQRRANRPRPRPDYGRDVLAERVVRDRTGSRGLLDLPGGVGLLDLPGGYRAERPRRPRGDDGDGFGWDYYGYGDGSGVQEPIGYRDYGYFDQQRDGRTRSGRGGFDYDRGYPYDHYRESAADERGESDYADAASVTRCRVTWTRDRKSREQVPVRICSR